MPGYHQKRRGATADLKPRGLPVLDDYHALRPACRRCGGEIEPGQSFHSDGLGIEHMPCPHERERELKRIATKQERALPPYGSVYYVKTTGAWVARMTFRAGHERIYRHLGEFADSQAAIEAYWTARHSSDRSI